jgi:hypothetical protein
MRQTTSINLKRMTIKDFGGRVADVWAGLRPVTRKMVVGAMQRVGPTNSFIPTISQASTSKTFFFDAHADWELSRLLTALDERVLETEVRSNVQKFREIKRMANACAEVLQEQTESAEVFIQLATRALRRADFDRLDKLANSLSERFSVGEMCEIVRQSEHVAIRALALEALALSPTIQLLPLLDDPVYADIIRVTLETQVVEYNSEEAKILLEDLAMELYL